MCRAASVIHISTRLTNLPCQVDNETPQGLRLAARDPPKGREEPLVGAGADQPQIDAQRIDGVGGNNETTTTTRM